MGASAVLSNLSGPAKGKMIICSVLFQHDALGTKDDRTVSKAILCNIFRRNLIHVPDEQREVVGANLQAHLPALSSLL